MALKNDAVTADVKEIGLDDVYLYQTKLFVLVCFEWC